jgi:uncharacterized OB-fold protein
MARADMDWAAGGRDIVFQRCGACGQIWYFHRDFCPNCSAAEVEASTSKGTGTVAAITVIHRGPGPEWQSLTPYAIALVDLDEGVRIMAHAEGSPTIGDPVRVAPEERLGRVMPVARSASRD